MSALDVQVGGGHYKDLTIQPVEFSTKNGLGFIEGCVIKRVVRHSRGGKGREDIEKAIHELQLLLELQYPAELEASPTGAITLINEWIPWMPGVGESAGPIAPHDCEIVALKLRDGTVCERYGDEWMNTASNCFFRNVHWGGSASQPSAEIVAYKLGRTDGTQEA